MKQIKDGYNNKINIYEYDDYISIPMPICYYDVDDDNGIRHYNFEEIANELENRICEVLNRKVSITIIEE